MSVNEIAAPVHGNGLHLVAFCCANSSAKAAELSKAPFQVDAVTVRLALLACSSKIQVLHVLRALETGADGVALWTCPQNSCRFGRGCVRAAKRIERARRILDQINVGGQRVFLQALEPNEPDALDKALAKAAQQLIELGKSPLKSVGVK
ncbi:MAG: hydrogenase iron-sulfur subunit [Phycisphaerae bacterium]|nr:hydrogenase iron-sulfur subunit [Phycisphaerae bacterium]